MRAQIRIHNDGRYTTNIDAVRADWDDKEAKASRLTLYGKFPAEDCQYALTYVMQFRTDIAFSLCKKFEKEGVADLTTDYLKTFLVSESFENKIQ